MKRGKSIMLWVLEVVGLFILGIVMWIYIPYSPIKSKFARLTSYDIAKMKIQNGIFTRSDISKLPLTVQKYFEYCGYIGTPKMWNMKAYYNDVDFILLGKPKLKIKYTHYNSIDKPERIALIDTSMFGIPFEGIDTYQNGVGSMKGVLGKTLTLFNQKGKSMDKACLVTYLAEGLLMPNSFLQDFINWEEIDETHAKATITYYGISASGIFVFDANGAITSFTTNDRAFDDGNGKTQRVKWSAVCGHYKDMNGIKQPTALKAIWHLETGDLVYFDSSNIHIKYNVAK